MATPDRALRVEIVTVTEKPLVLDIQLSGTLEAKNSVDLGFRQSGRVREVLIEEGMTVREGAPLARLDSVQQDQALKVAEAGLSAAQATLEQARQADSRAAAALERGVGTRVARDQAAQALSEARGAVERAETGVEQARRALEDTVLRASQDVVVTGRDLSVGQIVAAAQPVISLASTGGLEAVFHSPDHPLLDEARGAEVRLVAIDIDTREMTGIVTEIAPLVDPATGTVTVRARVQGMRSGTRLLGAAVRGHLLVESGAGLYVPWTALTREGETAAVWLVDALGKVMLTPVEVSHFSDGGVFLSDGVQAGDRVVGAGSQFLYPGRDVEAAEMPE